MQNIDTTVISQYSNSPVLTQLIANMNAWIDPSYNLEQFYDQLWNIDTAIGYGLDMLGRRVGIGRTLTLAASDFLGFSGNGGSSGDSFNTGIWYSGGSVSTNFTMTDDAYRQAILAKAAANITNGSIPSINQILLTLFPGRGNCYVVDNQNMTMTYVFKFVLQPFEISLVTSRALLPTPANVLPLYNYLT